MRDAAIDSATCAAFIV